MNNWDYKSVINNQKRSCRVGEKSEICIYCINNFDKKRSLIVSDNRIDWNKIEKVKEIDSYNNCKLR